MTGCLGPAAAAPPPSTRAISAHRPAEAAPKAAPAALRGWVNVNLVAVESIVAVVRQIDRAATAGDGRAVARGCATLQAALAQAQAGGPIPGAGAQAAWQAALDHLAVGAGLCVDGVPRADPSSILLSAQELATGISRLEQLVPGLRSAAQPR